VQAAGVSFGDVLQRVGMIPGGPKPPYTPGYDLTGVVEEVAEPGPVEPGQRVTALVREGGYAELVTVPVDRLVPVPDGLPATDVAAVALNYFVASQMLHRVARVSAGQRVVVHGAAGGVGTAFLQLARLAGVEAYGTASAGKLDLVRELGGIPIDYRAQDFVAVVRGLPGGGVDAVFDPVGGPHFRRSYRALKRGGILVGYGQGEAMRDGRAHRGAAVAGFLGGVVLPKLVPDGRRTTFYNAWSLEKSQPSAYREDLAGVLELLRTGAIRPVLARTVPLADAARAHELLERSAVRGKIVLTVDVPEPAADR
jgi:NADPH:quinone reductase-like Zn-dependent oxidoreductase